jgi:O-antigen ligase/tetratricopeptide (TPR) repeat protein
MRLPARSSLAWATVLMFLLFLGGTPAGDLNGWAQAADALLAVGLFSYWLTRANRMNDLTDRLVVAALLLLLLSAALSMFPRQSFTSVIQACGLAAGFVLARRWLRGRKREVVEAVLAWSSVLLVLVILPQWIATWVNWLATADWTTAPPLRVWLPVGVFANRHYVGTLALLLVPALWASSFRRRWPMVAWGTTLGIAAIVGMDGSRTLVLAALGASVVVLVGVRFRPRKSTVVRWTAGLIAAAVGAGVLAVGVGLPLAQRVMNTNTLDARLALWGNSLDAWLLRPIQGIGPGTYPWSYFLDGYLRLTDYTPRHPDNAVAQLLAEMGVLGIAATGLLLLGVWAGARRRWRQEPRAAWATVLFGIACMGTNPSDFLFLTVPALLWVAMLVPGKHARQASLPKPSPSRLQWVALAPLLLGAVLTSGASVAYQLGWDAFARGDHRVAASAITIATTLDPSEPAYWRERATLELVDGDAKHAVTHYARALALNPLDPAVSRGLALANLALSRGEQALQAAENAVRIRPFLTQDLIVLALAESNEGADSAAYSSLGSALLRAPSLMAVAWQGTALQPFDKTRAITGASRASSDIPASLIPMGRLLATIASGTGDVDAAAATAAGTVVHSARALAAASTCEPSLAASEIAMAKRTEYEEAYFWVASAIVQEIVHAPDAYGPDLSLIYLGYGTRPGSGWQSLLSGGVEGVWRYRRLALPSSNDAYSIPWEPWTLITTAASAFPIVTCDAASH